MKRKNPTHGGSRPGAGRPPTTGSRSMPVVSFRLSASQYHGLKVLGLSKPPRTPSRVAKDIVIAILTQSNGRR